MPCHREIEHLAEVLTGETGKPIRQARAELDATLPRIDFFLEHATEALADEVVHRDPSSGLEERISHEPSGVVGNISAWNYPWFVGTNVFVPALIAGNAVLYKPRSSPPSPEPRSRPVDRSRCARGRVPNPRGWWSARRALRRARARRLVLHGFVSRPGGP